MNTNVLCLALICLTLLTAHYAHAGDPGLRCEGYLVSKGMSETEVRKLCGTPASVERWHYDFTEPQGDTIIADLVYNFGSLKCSWLLRFENDRLVRVSQPETCHVHTGPVESLGYGYR